MAYANVRDWMMILDAIPDHAAILNSDATIEHVNRAWTAFGEANGLRTPRAGTGVNYIEVCERTQGEDRETALAVIRALRDIIAGKLPEYQCEYACHSPTERRWFMLKAVPLGRSAPFGILVLHDSVTECKLIQEKLEWSNAELREFASFTSHDLQEPLRSIRGFAQLLSERYRGHLDEAGQEFVDYISRSADRLDRLIRDMLSYFRIFGQESPVFEQVDLNAAVSTAIDGLLFTVQEKQAMIAVGNLPVVSGISSLLVQVFQNLIGNALKFCTAKPEIKVSAQRSPRGWIIAVEDNGVGIPPDSQQRIFLPFQRVRGGEVAAGTGLGLSVARKAIEMHGGTLWMSSEIGKGSTFYFSLPDNS